MKHMRKPRLFQLKNSVDMTEGSILRHILLFSIPLVVGNLFQQFYNTVDTWVVGNYVSNEAFSAVGTVGPITNLLIGIFMGFTTGASVVISQYFGAGDYKKVRQSVHTSLLITLILGAVFTVVGICMTPLMLRLMQTPADVYPESRTYLMIYFGGISALLIYNMGSAILRAVGDSLRPFYFLLACSVTNIILDLVFVLVFHMGVEGVALATVISEIVSAVLVLLSLRKADECVRIRLKDLRIDGQLLKQEMKVGIPQAVQMGLTAFSNVFVQGYVNAFGSDFMAGWTAYNKIDSFLWLPMQSIALAATTFVAQNLGKGDEKRARKGTWTALGASAVFTSLLAILVMLFRAPVVEFFNDKPIVVEYGSMLILCISPFCLCATVNQTLGGALRGAGDSTPPMIIMLISFVGIRQLYLFICTRVFADTMTVVTFSYPVGWICCSILLFIYYMTHKPSVETLVFKKKQADRLSVNN